MKKFYYSFGTDDMFPLKKGWIIMYANTRLEADRKQHGEQNLSV